MASYAENNSAHCVLKRVICLLSFDAPASWKFDARRGLCIPSRTSLIFPFVSWWVYREKHECWVVLKKCEAARASSSTSV
jgi:hypothetical protein